MRGIALAYLLFATGYITYITFLSASLAGRTATLAAFTTVFAAGQTAGPWLAGLLADHTSTHATLAWTAILCAAAALVSVIAGRSSRPAGIETNA